MKGLTECCVTLTLINVVKNVGKKFQSINALRYHRGNRSFFFLLYDLSFP